MKKVEIYSEVLARFLVLLFALPFAVVFLIFMAMGLVSTIFFNNLNSFTATTKSRLQLFDQQLKQK